jgi:asparagine synthase (glutamine-hydrolysing)
MCGIAGVFDPGAGRSLEPVARRMTAALRHRGPDAAGTWVDARAGIALGHRRLRILDLSDLGAQPMESADGRYVVVFNGEIYNFRELRKQLEPRGHAFRGTSDTEVLLAAVSEWGVERALAGFNGMFAFALWDRATRTLCLARDRAGEKPLYYGRLGSSVVFASELAAFEAHPAGPGEMSPEAVAAYLRFGYVPAPFSIYRRIRKLPPATWLQVSPRGETGEPVRYWRMPQEQPMGGEDAAEQLETLLSDAVRIETIADVPVGAFLSGGIDSSAVVAMMCRHARHVKTFTIGFAEAGYNEAPHARAVARHLGTAHTELEVTPAEAMAVIPRLPAIYSEPFADASQIPTFLVSQLARQHVTVALSGDGADELFGGYNRYAWAGRIWSGIRPFSATLRRAAASAIAQLPPSLIDRAVPSARLRNAGDKLHKLATLFAVEDEAELYLKLVSQWQQPDDVVVHGCEPEPHVASRMRSLSGGLSERMMQVDFSTYLPDDILVKVDRASMANGLEARAPFLDRRVIEFAARLPLAYKVRGPERKWLLRQVLDRHVPRTLVDRPKSGFAIPLHAWIRGPLREWAEALISERRLRAEGIFRPAPIRAKWREHLSGSRNWIAPLWAVLMFQAWREHRKSAETTELACVSESSGT